MAHSKKGIIIINVLIFGTIAVLVLGAMMMWAATLYKDSRQLSYREQALQIAESGIDYYRWHLAHAPTDYKDGTGLSGPYVHDFKDKDGTVIGQFTLTITPPLVGSTIVKIKSKGTVLGDPAVSRTIQVSLGIPSFAQYAYVSNSKVFYGSGDIVNGKIHSNVGVGFWNGSPQPKAYNLVTSALSTFQSSLGVYNFGVYTSVPTADPAPPAAVPNRPDVFAGGRQFPVPIVDFNSITADLATIKAKASTTTPPLGFYRAGSGALGYKIVLKTNDTFDLYRVNSLRPVPNNCYDSNAQNQPGWGTWSIGTSGGATTQINGPNGDLSFPFPANGLMFLEDHVWVEGQINTARLTIAVGVFPTNPSTNKNIIVNNNLTYTNFDSQDVAGLIAQGNFLVGMASANNLIIDAAIVAQNGQTIRYFYNANCTSGGTSWRYRSSLTTYGMFASYGQGYFYYGSSGYTIQNAGYDPNLLYAPPPNFPLTSDQYTTISWDEVKQ